MFDKIKNVLNIRAWVESFLFKKVLVKGVKHASTALIGIITSLLSSPKIAELLKTLGISINSAELTVGLSATIAGILGWIFNYVLDVIYKDEPKETKVEAKAA